MICPSVCTTHCLCHPTKVFIHVWKAEGVSDHVCLSLHHDSIWIGDAFMMPCFGKSTEACISNQQIMFSTFAENQGTIADVFTYTLNTYHFFSGLVVFTNLSIEFAKQDKHVCTWCSRNNTAYYIIKPMFSIT